MRIVLLGAPGSGKGTQARLIAGTYRIHHVSTGDLLHRAVSEGSELGRQVSGLMEEGALVPDDIVTRLAMDALQAPDSRRGFVLDGFPRNIPQAQELDTRLGWIGRPLQIAIHLSTDVDTLIRRITGRLVCDSCGATFNRTTLPPSKRGVCDYCGSKTLSHRSDDNERAARTRVSLYNEETERLITYFRAQHKLRTVSADSGVEEIFSAVRNIIDAEIRPLETKVMTEGDGLVEEVLTTIVGGKVEKQASVVKTARTVAVPVTAGQIDASQDGRGSGRSGASGRKKKSRKSKSPATSSGDSELAKSEKKTAKKTVVTGKSGAKKTVTKKAAAGKSATKKKTAGKKKVTVKKSTAKKKAVKKKAVARKSSTRKTASKKRVAAKKVVRKKGTSKSAGKSSSKTSSTRKRVSKKKVVKKAARKKTVRKAAGSKKTVRKKAAKKTAGGKKTVKKKSARKSTARKARR